MLELTRAGWGQVFAVTVFEFMSPRVFPLRLVCYERSGSALSPQGVRGAGAVGVTCYTPPEPAPWGNNLFVGVVNPVQVFKVCELSYAESIVL